MSARHFSSGIPADAGFTWGRFSIVFSSRFRALQNPYFFLSRVLPCEACMNFINTHTDFSCLPVLCRLSPACGPFLLLMHTLVFTYLLTVKTQIPKSFRIFRYKCSRLQSPVDVHLPDFHISSLSASRRAPRVSSGFPPRRSSAGIISVHCNFTGFSTWRPQPAAEPVRWRLLVQRL